MGYMRSPLISLCLHLRQTLGEDGGTKEIAAGIKGEVKERQSGRDRKNTAEQTLDRPRCDSLINDTVDGCTDGDAQWRDRHFWRLSNKKKNCPQNLRPTHYCKLNTSVAWSLRQNKQ